MSLTAKEMDFCRYYAACRNHREAAARAGYAFPDKSGLRLLEKEGILNEIETISENSRRLIEAADGFRRIAFGSVVDAVRLAINGVLPDDVENLDLFMISEIKLPKNGGIEIKFFDRIKALEALASLVNVAGREDTAPFIDAIFKGAAAITDAKRSDDNDI